MVSLTPNPRDECSSKSAHSSFAGFVVVAGAGAGAAAGAGAGAAGGGGAVGLAVRLLAHPQYHWRPLSIEVALDGVTVERSIVGRGVLVRGDGHVAQPPRAHAVDLVDREAEVRGLWEHPHRQCTASR